MTLKHLILLMDRYKLHMKREDMRAGLEWKEEEAPQSDEEFVESVKRWAVATGGS